MNSAGLKVSTPTDTTIVFTRSFNAPRRLVWEAMTDPAKLRRWLFTPPGRTMTVCEFEARVGSRYRWVWKSERADPWMTLHGVVTECVPHERIVHTQTMDMAECGPMEEISVTIEFTESGSVTRMRLTLTFASKVARDGALQWRMETGMEVGYQQLDAMLGQPA